MKRPRIFAKSESSTPTRTTFVASTSDPDRDGDILDQNGWQLDNYRKNPVVLWLHGRTPDMPIGKAVDIETGDELRITVEWDLEDELGAKAARKYSEGFLNAVSVGYYPHSRQLRSQLPKDDNRRTEGGWGEFQTDLELYELSCVPVPCNAMALAEKDAYADDGLKEHLSAAFEEQLAKIADDVAASQQEHLRDFLLELLSSDDEMRSRIAALAWATEEPWEPVAPGPWDWLLG